MARIRLEKLGKAFEDFVAVRESDLDITDGEFFALLGPSGCGKTTTLRMIAGLEMPTSGRILLDGQDVTRTRAANRDIAFVFQMFALYPHMRVRANIAYPLKCRGMPRREIRERVDATARLLQIEHLLDKRISSLAGGDRQRVALGRAIVRTPRAFLMDEPLGTLDAEFRERMCEELLKLHRRIGTTTVYVTHDQVEAMSMADRIAVMQNGDVLQVGTPSEIYERPATRFVGGFIGSPAMNFLSAQGRLERGSEWIQLNGAQVPIPALAADVESAESILGVRPEHVSIAENGPVHGEVYGVEYLGTRQILTVDTPVGRMKVRAPNNVRVVAGENVGLTFETNRLTIFDAATERAVPAIAREAGHHG